ncbi:FG-GAP-like repeat-containing protein [Maribacter sp. 2304DJ31-5]|uniref:FG-GAP-like repeat-containing protein n=1 Tax=Maribacter sp. 2304DJ31-5 TaxID=3386273 RepID=UPI0039BC4695
MKLIYVVLSLFCVTAVVAQDLREDKIKTTNFPKLKELVNTNIPGAITFSQPQLITGTKQEIRTEKHGLIYPAFFDWNKDGKKDLLLGEFETGETGSYVKVYLNEGSKKKPKYSGEYFYAKDVKGDTISNFQWCCIGIHPRIVDLDQDGYDDILSGQYNPGAISWWRGSKEGFLPKQFIEQEGYIDTQEQKYNVAPWKTESNSYWNYTTADFADFNGDGLLDLFVGGSGDMRVALNTGTKEKPKFGYRNYLRHIDGSHLYVKKPTQADIDKATEEDRYTEMSGVWKSYIKPTDWDKDGVLDLLVTYEYKKKGHNPVDFYRGVNTDKGLRFEKRVPLFTAKDGSKALPGVQPMMTLTDHNNDGVEDMVIGLSIPTINGFEVVDEIAWAWAGDLGIEMPGKDAGRQIQYYKDGLKGIIAKMEDPEQGKYFKRAMLGNLKDYKYLTMRHRGYVFVMYGKKATTKATVKTVKAAPAIKQKEIIREIVVGNNNEGGPVKYEIRVPKQIDQYNFSTPFVVEVTIAFDEGWHGYVNNEANKKDGFIPTTVAVEPSEYLEATSEMILPEASFKGLAKVYKESVTFRQQFKFKLPPAPAKRPNFDKMTPEEIKEFVKETSEKLEKTVATFPENLGLKTKITYQTCDDNICLPPKTVVEDLKIAFKH